MRYYGSWVAGVVALWVTAAVVGAQGTMKAEDLDRIMKKDFEFYSDAQRSAGSSNFQQVASYKKVDDFTFVIKTPPAVTLIKKAIKLDKGSSRPHVDKVGKITRAQLEEIAKTKMKDMTAADLDAAVRTIAGSARSMGVTVEGV